MGVPLSTLTSYTVLAAVGFLLWRNWGGKRTSKSLPRPTAHRQREEERQAVQAKKEKQKSRPRAETPAAAASQESKPKPQPPAQPPAWAATTTAADSSDDGVDNREFARQLSSVKEGTKFASKSKDERRAKSVKQSRAQEKASSNAAEAAEAGRLSAPSSTAGIDADDDQSPTPSPVVKAADALGVSDMLEKPAPGPSVLRLTDVEEKKPKQKKAKAPEPVETKKQRQNRRKVEEAKAMREQAEKERRVKMEAQRRLAREAEGRAAKDGSAFVAAQAKPSAWAAPNGAGRTSPSQASSATDGLVPVQPLDTFESSNVQTDASKSSAAPSVGKPESWISSLPSEEEQMEMLREEEAWSTVKTKARKGKKKDAGGDSNDDSAPAKPLPLAPVTNQQKQAPPATNGRPITAFSKQSSFAALSTDEPEEPEEPEEQEWDV